MTSKQLSNLLKKLLVEKFMVQPAKQFDIKNKRDMYILTGKDETENFMIEIVKLPENIL